MTRLGLGITPLTNRAPPGTLRLLNVTQCLSLALAQAVDRRFHRCFCHS
jgi:hypothetical protein